MPTRLSERGRAEAAVQVPQSLPTSITTAVCLAGRLQRVMFAFRRHSFATGFEGRFAVLHLCRCVVSALVDKQ